MEKIIKVNYQGKLVDAVEMEFKAKEEWNIYELSDGTILRMKPVATTIIKVLNEYDPSGNPSYMLQSSNVLGVSAPEELKKGYIKPKAH
jgi:hypothetical protein